MRIVFLGTPAFAVPALKRLIDHGYEIGAVFTQPDRPSGRGQKLHPTPVKALALDAGIQVFQPEKIRLEENRAIFDELQPDFIVVAAFGQILPRWLLESARLGSVNIHASLLPRYRGAAPISWALIDGNSSTGITTMLMAEKLDAGPILLQQEIPIPLTMTAGELSDVLSEIGADLLVRTLIELENGRLTPAEQDEGKVTWAPRIGKEMAEISWEMDALKIHNRIRGMNPWPVAYSTFRGSRLQIWRSLPESGLPRSAAAPGTFLGTTETGLRVQCGEGTVLELLEVQLPGKARVAARAFANGARLHDGERLFQ